MALPKIFEDIKPAEQRVLEEMRRWATAQGSANEALMVAGKLGIVQRVIDSAAVTSADRWKLNALGVLFGDALEQAMERRLSWVVVEDDLGHAFALSWKHTEILVYPLWAIRSRVEEGLPVNVYVMFAEYSAVFPFQQR